MESYLTKPSRLQAHKENKLRRKCHQCLAGSVAFCMFSIVFAYDVATYKIAMGQNDLCWSSVDPMPCKDPHYVPRYRVGQLVVGELIAAQSTDSLANAAGL